MRQPTGEEQGDARLREVGRAMRSVREVIAGVVEDHHRHDQAAEDVDALQTLAFARVPCFAL